MLDRELLDLPRDSYGSKLKELTHDNYDTITWYRNTLASRARSIEGCPFFFRYTILLQDVEDYVLLHAWVFTKIFT